MRPVVAIGLVLVLAGALTMLLQLTGAFTETVGVDLGPVELEASRERSLPWLPWAAGAAVLVGLVLMLSGRRG
jgi:hypothetical protein